MFPENLADIKKFLPSSPLTRLEDPVLEQFELQIYIKRDDLIDTRISGNKFRKLKYGLVRYFENNYSGMLSFGGPWSNHLHAFSCVAEKYNIPSVAIVRGHKPETPSHTLVDILQSGTDVKYVSRDEYRQMRTFMEQGKLSQHPLLKQWTDYMIIPEGGCSTDALSGVADIIAEDEQKFDTIYLACGTGATLAGLSIGLAQSPDTQLTGISALRAGTSLQQNVQRLLQSFGQDYSNNWMIDKNFHFGGFAKINPELINFMNKLYKSSGLVTEPVYTGKCLYALYQHIQQGRFAPGSRIMMVHTGGLQGLRGYRGRGIGQLLSAAGY